MSRIYLSPYHKRRVDYIAKLTCDEFNLQGPDIKSKCRKQPITQAKSIIWAICRDLFWIQISWQTLANYFGVQTHSSALLGAKKCDEYRKIYPIFEKSYQKILLNYKKEFPDEN